MLIGFFLEKFKCNFLALNTNIVDNKALMRNFLKLPNV